MAYSLFIAHASDDGVLAAALKTFVESVFNTAEVFLSEDTITGGAGWFERIRESLEERPIILALVTPKSMESTWVHFEAGAGFVERRTIPICGGGARIADLRSPFRDLNAREITAADVELLVGDLVKQWGHSRLPAGLVVKEQKGLLIEADRRFRESAAPERLVGQAPPSPPNTTDAGEVDLHRLVDLAFHLDRELRDWEGLVRLASTNGVSLKAFLAAVYDYDVPPDADWYGPIDQDNVLKDELRRLPSDLHRVVIEYSFGLWFRPIPPEMLAPALQLALDELDQKRETAVSILREHRVEAVHRFRRALETEYRITQ